MTSVDSLLRVLRGGWRQILPHTRPSVSGKIVWNHNSCTGLVIIKKNSESSSSYSEGSLMYVRPETHRLVLLNVVDQFRQTTFVAVASF